MHIVYLGNVNCNAYKSPVFTFGLTCQPTFNHDFTGKTVFLPVNESDYDAIHRLIDSRDGSRRFSFTISLEDLTDPNALTSAREIHVVFPFPSPKKDYIIAYIVHE